MLKSTIVVSRHFGRFETLRSFRDTTVVLRHYGVSRHYGRFETLQSKSLQESSLGPAFLMSLLTNYFYGCKINNVEDKYINLILEVRQCFQGCYNFA